MPSATADRDRWLGDLVADAEPDERGEVGASSSGQRAPSTVTPAHGPCMASTENVVPAGQVELDRARARGRRAAGRRPTTPRATPHAASAGAPSAPRAATAWSSRSPWPATSRISWSGRAAAAWATASSVSVAALSTGWRTTSVCSDAQARPIAEIESRSPTRTLGSSPAARAWSRPPSAAMIAASRGTAATARAIERRCAGDHHDRVVLMRCIPPPALPGSGSRVGGGSHPLSPLVPRAPRVGRRPRVAVGRARRWLTTVKATSPTMTSTMPGTCAGRICLAEQEVAPADGDAPAGRPG